MNHSINKICHSQGRLQLPEGSSGGQEGRAWWAAEGVHQRMAQAEGQGGRGAQEAKGQTSQEEGNQVHNDKHFWHRYLYFRCVDPLYTIIFY
jgi:hypothetical protein